MSNLILKHILKKHFGSEHPRIEYAAAEIEQLYKPDPLEKIVETSGYKPAYQDASNTNLHSDGTCRFCRMVWYNCLCAHGD